MFRRKIQDYINRIKELNGDPHYIAFGMAIGVFVAVTPTIPFHTVLAIALAILLNASKPAAILGAWVSNPFTVVLFYVACYKTGHLFFENSSQAVILIQQLLVHLESDSPFLQKIEYLKEFAQTQFDTFLIMNVGGIVLGLPAGVFTYVMTRRFFIRFRSVHIK